MSTRTRIGPALLALVATVALAPAATAAEWTAEQATERLGRGVNLGNALEAPSFEGEWGMVIEDQFLALIAGAGFDSIRLPVRWDTRASASPPYTIDQTALARVDHIVEVALANDLAVIIDFHHFDGLHADPAGNRERFVAIWRQLAEHYAGHPKEVMFELQNEPHDNLSTEVWEEIAAETLAAVRETNPDRMVVIGAGFWNSATELDNLDLPDDPALIGTFHMYEPFQFTHQGADWVGEESEEWLGTTWHEMIPEDTEPILGLMEAAEAWSAESGIPVLMGEFGAYEEAPFDSRVRFTSYVARQAEARGFAWAYWEFGAGFGIYDREAEAWRTELLEALIPPARFDDVDGSEFVEDIEWLAASGITRGCSTTSFCPDRPVTRGEMAAFLVRAGDLPGSTDDAFTDDDTSVFEDDIDALAAAEITKGCSPTTFCPDRSITRGEMAAFLVRAYGLEGAGPTEFVDDDASVFEDDIEALAAAEITFGCNPPAGDRFCPGDPVTRGQMAAFLRRAET
jgi:endoglucanase